MKTCQVCGHVGDDVREYPYYDTTLKRAAWGYFCTDIDACLDRYLPDYYRKSWELHKTISFQCQYCPFISPQFKELVEHYESVHSGIITVTNEEGEVK